MVGSEYIWVGSLIETSADSNPLRGLKQRNDKGRYKDNGSIFKILNRVKERLRIYPCHQYVYIYISKNLDSKLASESISLPNIIFVHITLAQNLRVRKHTTYFILYL